MREGQKAYGFTRIGVSDRIRVTSTIRVTGGIGVTERTRITDNTRITDKWVSSDYCVHRALGISELRRVPAGAGDSRLRRELPY